MNIFYGKNSVLILVCLCQYSSSEFEGYWCGIRKYNSDLVRTITVYLYCIDHKKIGALAVVSYCRHLWHTFCDIFSARTWYSLYHTVGMHLLISAPLPYKITPWRWWLVRWRMKKTRHRSRKARSLLQWRLSNQLQI